jgi:hypothetical protein
MDDQELVRRASKANIRSYCLALTGLLVLIYATFFQQKPQSVPALATCFHERIRTTVNPCRSAQAAMRQSTLERTVDADPSTNE